MVTLNPDMHVTGLYVFQPFAPLTGAMFNPKFVPPAPVSGALTAPPPASTVATPSEAFAGQAWKVALLAGLGVAAYFVWEWFRG